MYKIEIKDHFSAAHFLEDYDGLCGSVHGHRWEVVLSAKLQFNLETEMLVDFTELKEALHSIVKDMDHSFILNPKGNEASRDFYVLAKKYNMRVYPFYARTTAENLAHYIWNKVQEITGWTTHSIQVFEAPNNAVTYTEE